MEISLMSKIFIFVIVAILHQNSSAAGPLESLTSIPAKLKISGDGTYHFRCPRGFDLAEPATVNHGTTGKGPDCVPSKVTPYGLPSISKWASWEDSSPYSSEEIMWGHGGPWGGNWGPQPGGQQFGPQPVGQQFGPQPGGQQYGQ